MSLFASDPVGAALHSALDGLSYRQRVAANDIANADTPNFTASSVDFEDSLRSELENGTATGGDTSVSVSPSTAQRGANGNNVDLAAETLTAMQSTYRYQLLSRAVGDRFQLISTAIGGAS